MKHLLLLVFLLLTLNPLPAAVQHKQPEKVNTSVVDNESRSAAVSLKDKRSARKERRKRRRAQREEDPDRRLKVSGLILMGAGLLLIYPGLGLAVGLSLSGVGAVLTIIIFLIPFALFIWGLVRLIIYRNRRRRRRRQ